MKSFQRDFCRICRRGVEPLCSDDLERAEEEEVVVAQRSILDQVRRQYDAGRIDTYFGSAERKSAGSINDKKMRTKKNLRRGARRKRLVEAGRN